MSLAIWSSQRWRSQVALAVMRFVVACASSGCVSGVVDDVDDDDASMDAPGGGLDAGGRDGGIVAPGVDSALPTGSSDAASGPGMDTGLPPDAGGSPGGSTPRDSATPPMEAGGGGANPEPGRLAGITAAHNAARARVDTATPIPPLEWGEDIHAVAQAYADKLAASCSGLVHSSSQERKGWGENLAMMGGTAGSAQQAVDLWESELKCYTYGAFQGGTGATCSSACASYGGCGHYTQIVWRKTRRVGCGVAECGSGLRKQVYWVCNYDPPGNYQGQRPY